MGSEQLTFFFFFRDDWVGPASGAEKEVVGAEEVVGTPSRMGIMSGAGSLQASHIIDQGFSSHESNLMQRRASR